MACNCRSAERKPQDCVYLVVRKPSGQWQFPQAAHSPGETVRQARQHCCATPGGLVRRPCMPVLTLVPLSGRRARPRADGNWPGRAFSGQCACSPPGYAQGDGVFYARQLPGRQPAAYKQRCLHWCAKPGWAALALERRGALSSSHAHGTQIGRG